MKESNILYQDVLERREVNMENQRMKYYRRRRRLKSQGTSSEMKDGEGFVNENVVNLSDRELSIAKTRVLSKGLNFGPTPWEINRLELNKDLHEFTRRMKCKAYLQKNGKGNFFFFLLFEAI